MWVLRRPTDITQVTCINLNKPFTIGRIGNIKNRKTWLLIYLFLECSFNISDDKSVSRRHASITFPPSLILPLLTDCNSKFSTFVNGDRITTPVQLKHGDTVKFGGATSEFVVEAKDFTVYTKSQKNKGMFRELKAQFGIEVVTNVQEAAYFVIDDNEQINEIDTDLISAFLSCKCIVSPYYFSQLLQSNTMSLGLIQPTITSKMFPVDCWLPRKERLNVLRNAFEGIKRFVLLGGDKNENMVKIIGNALGIETKSIQSYELRELKFNELFVVSSIYPDAKDLKDPIRTVKYQSIIEAVVRCDGKLIEINTVYPEKLKEPERNVTVDEQPKERPSFLKETPSSIEPKERVLLVDQYQSMSIERLPSSIELPLPAPVNDFSFPQDLDYKGPSLTAVVPMPAKLLRPTQSQSSSVEPDTNGKKPKFVKCHPRHRLPGTIPALFGPDQLQPCRPTTITNSNITGNVQGLKRRVLVKDSWLAEDDLVDEDAQGSSAATIVVKENKLQRNIEQVTNSYTITNVNKSNQTNAINQSTTNISSNTNTIPLSATTTNITNPASNSKFQSSFFKNLSKGK